MKNCYHRSSQKSARRFTHGETKAIWIVETKGREELDLPQKMARLKQWCADATAAEENGQRYDFVFVDQNGFEKHTPKNVAALAASFTEYRVLASMPTLR
jgi:type III restriction enzyme